MQVGYANRAHFIRQPGLRLGRMPWQAFSMFLRCVAIIFVLLISACDNDNNNNNRSRDSRPQPDNPTVEGPITAGGSEDCCRINFFEGGSASERASLRSEGYHFDALPPLL